MKKTSLSILSAISLFAFSACASKDPISESKAMEYAAKDAGFKANEVTFSEQSYDKDDNQYDFTFQTSTEKYEYEIDGDNGNVISKSKEALKNTGTTNNDTETGATTDATGNNLSEEQWTFLNIALTQFQVNKDEITGVKVEKDSENGVPTYDVEFYKGQTEYSCEIQIDNQTILSTDMDQN